MKCLWKTLDSPTIANIADNDEGKNNIDNNE